MNYGIPYMGSKSGIVEEIGRRLPSSDNFYDLFGGGFSVTHFMLKHRSKDYKHFYFNEIRPGICELIQDAIQGKYNYDVFRPKWISREEFHAKKDIDPYIKIVWSFANNGQDYLFGPDIEPHKKSMHNAVVFNEFDDYAKDFLGMDKFRDGYTIKDKRLFVTNRAKKIIKKNELDRLQQLQKLQQLDRLQRLERLEQLQQLQQLERLQQLAFTNTCYSKVDIKPNSIIYCDPPYNGTGQYDNDFDHRSFLDWAANQKVPVFISEYNISDNRFHRVFSIKKRQMFAPDKTVCIDKLECLYTNKLGFQAMIRKL